MRKEITANLELAKAAGLHPNTVRETLMQAVLDSPIFETRWRWSTTLALAVPRNRGGAKVPNLSGGGIYLFEKLGSKGWEPVYVGKADSFAKRLGTRREPGQSGAFRGDAT